MLARDWANKRVNVNMLAPTDLNAAWFETPAGEKQIGIGRAAG